MNYLMNRRSFSLLAFFSLHCFCIFFNLELWNRSSAELRVKDSLDTPCSETSGAIRHANVQPSLSAGSGTFILLTHLSRIWGGASHARQKVQAGLVTVWGLR